MNAGSLGSVPDMVPPIDVRASPLSIRPIVYHDQELFVACEEVAPYPSGLFFRIAVRSRSARLAFGRSIAPPGQYPFRIDEIEVGVEYMGRPIWVRPSGFVPPVAAGAAHEFILVPQSGSGTQSRWEQAFWLSPLPVGGPLLILFKWPRAGVSDQRIAIDHSAISDAVGRVQRVWPRGDDD